MKPEVPQFKPNIPPQQGNMNPPMNPPMNIPPQFHSQNRESRDYYLNSSLKMNSIQELCRELTTTEVLENNVEKILCEMSDSFLETVVDSACLIARHRKSENITIKDLAFSVQQNFNIFEPGKYTKDIYKINNSQFKNHSTEDHKKRLELTKEDTKNVNASNE